MKFEHDCREWNAPLFTSLKMIRSNKLNQFGHLERGLWRLTIRLYGPNELNDGGTGLPRNFRQTR